MKKLKCLKCKKKMEWNKVHICDKNIKILNLNIFNFIIILYFVGMILDIISSIMVIDGINIIESNPLLSCINEGKIGLFIATYLILHLLYLVYLYIFRFAFKYYKDKIIFKNFYRVFEFYRVFDFIILFMAVCFIISAFFNFLI